ncbi:MAG: cyanophycin synthetase [Legionella sp.]|nr:MAG: cyanophycin synthetase [Legionella sp.]
MNILNVQVLNGPNYWSNYRKKLIVLTIDLQEFELFPTNRIENFNNSLKSLIPSLYEHRCSVGTEGGFYVRLEEGTWLGHVIEHVALELQTLAGMDAGFGRTFGTDKEGIYKVIFSYQLANAGLYAGKAAFNLVESLALGRPYLQLENDLDELRQLFANEKFGPSTEAIIKEAQKRQIPFTRIKNNSLIILGHGCNQKKVWATVSSETKSIPVEIASDKELTKDILKAQYIPVPEGITIHTLEQLDKAINELHFPLVIKPLNGNHGRGVLTKINSREKAIIGFELAKKVSPAVIVERFISGEDYRFLVINYQLVATAKRTPAMVIGTGAHSIQELIDRVNQDPKRGKGHENMLTSIQIDDDTVSLLMEQKLSLDSILPENKVLYLKGTANLSSGGTATDVTSLVHPANKQLVERVARLIDLDVCGIDIVADSISEPIREGNGAVIEVNAGPGFRMHLQPSEGKSRNVAEPLLDMLYPTKSSATIPIIAVTGTNGKTTVVRLIAHLAKKANHQVGFTTTEGIYIRDQLIYAGDCSGPVSAKTVLMDPWVNFAVLECARGGILRSGLAFDECDISIITNVTGDHLGLKGIHTLEELVQVKAVLAHSTKKTGYAILNSEDELVYALKEELSCQVALFGLEDNVRIKEHCLGGGIACFLENGFIVIQEGKNKHVLAQINAIPMTLNGAATCMIRNILPAVLAGVISQFPISQIATALYEFLPTADYLPGRMNIFTFQESEIMVDYAHNEGAYIELNQFMQSIKKKKKIGIISAPGDRRPEDIEKVGYYSAQMFDEIIIKHDKDTRGRSNEQLTDLIKRGVFTSTKQPIVHVISDEFEAVRYALDNNSKNAFIFYNAEDVFAGIDFVKEEQNRIFQNEFIMESNPA